MVAKSGDWQAVVVPPSTPMLEALKVIETHYLKICLVAEDDQRLLGTLTDGDVRRALLAGMGMSTPIAQVMNHQPRKVSSTTSIEAQVQKMRALKLHVLVLVEDQNKIVGVSHLDSLVASSEVINNVVVLMAGGHGRRLRPLTESVPKPLLTVGDRPILETIIENFVAQAFRHFYICVNYRAPQIMDYFGDGTSWGAKIEYLQEKVELGTAGALSMIKPENDLPLIVMNGDLLTKVNFLHLLQYHDEHNVDATMCVREYGIQVPYGVVQIVEDRIKGIDEKPDHKFFVNAGIYVINPGLIQLIPKEVRFDMPTLFERIISSGRSVNAFPLHEYWRDVGQFDELRLANDEFSNEFVR